MSTKTKVGIRVIRAVVVMAALVLAVGTAAPGAQSVNEEWKQRNLRSNRWEGGDLSMPVNARPLELVGFLAEPREPLFTSGEVLTVRFYLPKESTVVHLYAREVEVKKHYWMQARPAPWTAGWNAFAPWPTADVLQKLGVSASSVGVLVRLDDRFPADGLVAPALLASVSEPGARIGRYTARFLSGAAFSGGTFNVRPGCADRRADRLVAEGRVGPKRTGVGFNVDFDITSEAAGDYTLTVAMQRSTPPPAPAGQKPQLLVEHNYCFHHEPTPGLGQ